MAQLPFNLGEILSAPEIRPQLLASTEALAKVLGDTAALRGRSYEICQIWQRRLELALRSEIPEWTGLAGFRCLVDFSMKYSEFIKILGELSEIDPTIQDYVRNNKIMDTLEKCLHLLHEYFDNNQDLHSGKVTLDGTAQERILQALSYCVAMLGGQAGNILWVWRSIGADAVAYIPYLSSRHINLQEKYHILKELKVISVEDNEGQCRPLIELYNKVGVRMAVDRAESPLNGAITVAKDGRRLIFGIKGNRDMSTTTSWDAVVFSYKGTPLHPEPIPRMEQADPLSWPSIGFFADMYIDIENTKKILRIRLLDDAEVEQHIGSKVDFAVLGGINCIFYDPWYSDKDLRNKVKEIIHQQLKTLRKCGVRIGVELSGIPDSEFAQFLTTLCREETIVALGINGVDELPDITRARAIEEPGLRDFAMDHNDLLLQLTERAGVTNADPSFEYLTYLRAKHFAKATGVRTLYVHTLSLDLILRKNADPGSLLRAQLGDIMSKGLVIAAMLQRTYQDNWSNEVQNKMPPAVKPEAMKSLGTFAMNFRRYEKLPLDSVYHILRNGYWLATSQDEYSVAVVPVVWPNVDAIGGELPDKLNTTGSGDMTFGTFFFLAGV